MPDFPDRLSETNKNGSAHNRVTDVQLFDALNGGHRPDIVHGQTVSGVHGEAERAAVQRGDPQALECARIIRGMGVRSGVQFHGVRTDAVSGGDGLDGGIDKQTTTHPGAFQSRYGECQLCDVPHDVQSSFCGYFHASFGYQSHLLRAQSFSQGEHLVQRGALQVEDGANGCGESLDIVVLHVASVFAQMGGNAIGAGRFTEECGVDRIGFGTAPGLSQRGHVVDVHEQTQRRWALIAGAVGGRYVRVSRRGGKSCVIHAGNAAKEEAVRKTVLKAGFVIVALVTSACSSATSGGGTSSRTAPAPLAGSTAGATSAKESVELFMRAVKAQDLQTMSAVWGTSRGPARELMGRDELEKRLIIIQCKLDHETWGFAVDKPRLVAGGKQDFQVKLRTKQSEATTSFTTIMGPENRWFVEIVDMEPLRDFCR